MEFREVRQSDIDYMIENSINKDLKQLRAVDYIYTLEHEGIPLLVGGFRLINDTTAWCWADISHEASKHTTMMYRVIKEWIDKFTKEHNIKRLQAAIRCSNPEARRMVKHLGFQQESVMPYFFGDESGYMYRKII